MASQGFVDLDELVLLCRNDKARSFIQEAILCYKAGAFRQTIVATWIAVVYDVIHKFQELELAGDANASKHLERFEKIRQAGDLKGSLEFERNILNVAQKDFELISDIEYIDLARLQEDRNRCAHPAMNTNDEIYQPSPELARTHLRNAIEHLLQRPPVQGKAALSRLLTDIASEYFPTVTEDAVKYFSAGPLAKPRASLVRNFVIVLTKEFLDNETDELKNKRILSALLATMHIHRGISQATIADKLNEIIINLPDEALHLAISYIFHIEGSWDYLGEDAKNKLKTYILNLPYEHESTVLFYALNVRGLQNDAEKRLDTVRYFSLAEIVKQEKNTIRPLLVRKSVEKYLCAGSFDGANYIGSQLVIPLAEYILPEEIEPIIQACAENRQIKHSYQKNNVLTHLRGCKIISTDDFDTLLVKYGIEDINPEI